MWDLFDILNVAVRWIHAVSAVLWIGGSIFFLVALRPALRDASKREPAISRLIPSLVAAHFREWVHLSMVALLVSGAILTFDRLTEPSTSPAYVGTLVAKIAISFWLFGIGTATYRKKVIERAAVEERGEGHRGDTGGLYRWLRPLASPSMVVYGGLVVVLLSNVLKIVFEKGIS
ncbi:MAG: urate hydroxylase PuuD [Dehalococcoidia bacterium]